LEVSVCDSGGEVMASTGAAVSGKMAESNSSSSSSSEGCSCKSVLGNSGVKSGLEYCTLGWCRTSRGRNELSKTKLAPKDVLEMIASKALSRYSFEGIGKNNIVARDPRMAKKTRRRFL